MTQISGSLDTPLPATAPTLPRLILDRIARTPDGAAFAAPRPHGAWQVRTWAESGREMQQFAAGLLELGLQPEKRVAIASSTRVEWILADGGVMLSGGANTTIYPSTGNEDHQFIMSDSGARFLVAEDQAQADKALTQLDQLPAVERIILIDGAGDGDKVLSWDEVLQLGRAKLADTPDLIEQVVETITPESLATLIYTSGTTGRPKA
jgi:long-chain acyl-CoA synthetase